MGYEVIFYLVSAPIPNIHVMWIWYCKPEWETCYRLALVRSCLSPLSQRSESIFLIGTQRVSFMAYKTEEEG